MRVLPQRTQGRGLFDLCHAWRQSEAVAPARVDGDPVVAAFEDYVRREDVVVTQAEYRRSLATKLADRSFRTDMAAMLRSGTEHYDIDRAARLVDEIFVSGLR